MLALVLAVSGVLAQADCPVNRVMPVDPVELRAGREVAGKAELSIAHEGFEYRFASPENRARFEKDAGAYAAADAGACGAMGPLAGLGDARRFLVHDGRLYFFASDACRETFRADPARFVETDDPAPGGTPEEREAGLKLVDRMIAWAGGAERVKSVRTFSLASRRTVRTTSRDGQAQDWTVTNTFVGEFPGTFAHRSSWALGEKDHWAISATSPRGGVASTSGGSEPFAPARQRALTRWITRHPLVLLRARFEDGFEARAAGSATLDGADVDHVWIAWRGASSMFSVDRASGRPIAQSFRGRDGTARVLDVARTFTAYAESEGVKAPTAWTGSGQAKRGETLDAAFDAFVINGPIDRSWFEPPATK